MVAAATRVPMLSKRSCNRRGERMQKRRREPGGGRIATSQSLFLCQQSVELFATECHAWGSDISRCSFSFLWAHLEALDFCADRLRFEIALGTRSLGMLAAAVKQCVDSMSGFQTKIRSRDNKSDPVPSTMDPTTAGLHKAIAFQCVGASHSPFACWCLSVIVWMSWWNTVAGTRSVGVCSLPWFVTVPGSSSIMSNGIACVRPGLG